jgi:hypothetical protein
MKWHHMARVPSMKKEAVLWKLLDPSRCCCGMRCSAQKTRAVLLELPDVAEG